MEKLELKSRITAEDLNDYQKSQLIKYFFSLRNLFSIVIFFALSLSLYLRFREYFGDNDYLGCILIAITLNIIYFITSYAEWKTYNKKFAEYHTVYSKAKKDIITMQGNISYYDGVEAFHGWDEYSMIIESKSIIKLVLKDGIESYISKSAFNTQSELDFFNECTANIKRG